MGPARGVVGNGAGESSRAGERAGPEAEGATVEAFVRC